MIKVAINGFGRIGRLALREMLVTTDFDVVAINDLQKSEDLAYLFKYDTTHGRFHEDLISYDEKNIIINNVKKIPVFNESDPSKLPWSALGVDLVLECTGHFTTKDKAMSHIIAGAKKVLISAPSKSDDVKMVVANVNENILDGSEQIISSASCTTNCLAPVLNAIKSSLKIKYGYMSTIHAITNDQATLDIPHQKGYMSRRGRAGTFNIVPTSTGAAKAIGKVIPELDGKLDGEAYRVPVMDGSLIVLVLEIEGLVTKEIVNDILIKSQNETLKVSSDPIVSSDIIGNKCGALVDSLLTKVITSQNTSLVKIVAWYDNEMGYTSQMLRVAKNLKY